MMAQRILIVVAMLLLGNMSSTECWGEDVSFQTSSSPAKSDVSRFVANAKDAIARKDFALAASSYRQAAALGDTSSMYELGQIYSGAYGVNDFVLKAPNGEAEHWFRQAADHGNPSAMYSVGFVYFNAKHGAMKPEDLAASLPWFEKSANLGYAPAITQLGVMYKNGFGVSKDEAKAAQYFLKAAQMGDGQAMDNIGVMYNQGTGVPKDTEEAVRWWKKAVAIGGQPGKAAQTWLDAQEGRASTPY